MGLKARRKNVKVGDTSKAMIIPAGLYIGEDSSIAANRIGLVDFRGEISEDDLLDFLEEEVEPRFWKWLEEKKKEGG